MAALPKWFYQDPARWLEEEQERSCTGCMHKLRLWGLEYCAKEQTKPGALNMRRCKHYEEKGAR